MIKKVGKVFGGLILIVIGIFLLCWNIPIYWQRIKTDDLVLLSVIVFGFLLLFQIGLIVNGIMILLKILAPDIAVAKKILAWWEEKEDKK